MRKKKDEFSLKLPAGSSLLHAVPKAAVRTSPAWAVRTLSFCGAERISHSYSLADFTKGVH